MKKITAVVLFCAILLFTPTAMARLNWYDRVLQPIVTNIMAPAWVNMINEPFKVLYTLAHQMAQKISPINLEPMFGIPIISPQTTEVEEHEKERISFNELFKSELGKVTTIGMESPGIFGDIDKTIQKNSEEWKRQNKKKDTVLNFDREIKDEVLNRDENGKENSNVPLALKVTLNSTPQAIKLLDPETRKETTDYLSRYQIQIYNEKITENEESLKRISELMEQLERVLAAGFDNSAMKEANLKELNDDLEYQQKELSIVEEQIALINGRYNTQGTNITGELADKNKEMQELASHLAYLSKEEQRLEDMYRFSSGITERWEYLKKRNELQEQIKDTEYKVRQLSSAMTVVNQNYLNNAARMTEELRPYNTKAEAIRKKIDTLTKDIAAQQKSMGTVGTEQQEAERKALVSTLRTAIKDEQMKMKMSTERVEQVENMLNEQREIVEQKVGIASMQYYGFDPYNPDEEDQKRGILPIEKLDRGYVTSKGLRKP